MHTPKGSYIFFMASILALSLSFLISGCFPLMASTAFLSGFAQGYMKTRTLRELREGATATPVTKLSANSPLGIVVLEGEPEEHTVSFNS